MLVHPRRRSGSDSTGLRGRNLRGRLLGRVDRVQRERRTGLMVVYEQLTLEPAEPRKPLPRPSSLAPAVLRGTPPQIHLPGLRCRCGRWSGVPALMSGEPLPELLDAKQL